ncbi:MAG: hypothetical protein M3Q07_13500 [Pseudobdellovibrionaceae bacterium]|nr:hypothetical protein [Pseudobdellovibrionaceae bacterium]
MDDNLVTQSGKKIEADFFEYSERSTALKPSALPTKAVALISIEDAPFVASRNIVALESTGEKYFVKESMNSGVGLLEITLEKQGSGEAITHGKF